MYEIGLDLGPMCGSNLRPIDTCFLSVLIRKMEGTTNEHRPTRSPKDRHTSDFFGHLREGPGPKSTTSYERLQGQL